MGILRRTARKLGITKPKYFSVSVLYDDYLSFKALAAHLKMMYFELFKTLKPCSYITLPCISQRFTCYINAINAFSVIVVALYELFNFINDIFLAIAHIGCANINLLSNVR
jgi:hypothetical protein